MLFGKYDFEDLTVGMLVRTWQSKHVETRIIGIGDNPYHLKLKKDNSEYVEEIHFLNIYQIFINNEWVQFTY